MSLWPDACDSSGSLSTFECGMGPGPLFTEVFGHGGKSVPLLLVCTCLSFGWKTGLGCRFQIYNLFSSRLDAGGRTQSKACHCCAVSQVPWLRADLSQV